MKDKEKLTLQSHDWVADNQHAFTEFVKEKFPNCITEGRVDMDLLRQEVSSEIVEGPKERYRLEWAGKREAIVAANTPTNATLRPIRDKSVNFDTTENLYIEGDNLEVLKLLQESYLGKIKMIYIDPPYNTGKEFVYNDKFSIDDKARMIQEGLIDEDGNVFTGTVNSIENTRYHSDWLSFMYPRLKIARNLMSEDGVIFISIDDNEVHNLRKMCDEIFGAENFIDIFNWSKTETPANLSKKSKKIIEYILCYQKEKDSIPFKGIKKESQSSNGLLNQSNSVHTLVFPENEVTTSIPDGIIPKGKYGTSAYEVELEEDTEVKNGVFVKPIKLRAKFKWQQDNLKAELAKGTTIRIPTMNFSPSYEKKEYAPEVPPNLINSKVGVGTNENAGTALEALFGKKVFSFPKPVSLLKYLLSFRQWEEKTIVLDFFSGSATLAEAVLELNAGGDNRQFICIQLPELIEIKSKDTEEERKIKQNAIDFLSQIECQPLVSEIGEERIRRAAKKIQEENPEGAKGKDMGFRVFRLDSSNKKEVKVSPDDLKQTELDWEAANNVIDNIKEGRTGEDLLFQVMLAWGLPLSLPVAESEIIGKKVYRVEADGVLILLCCFENGVDEAFAEAVAKQMPMRVLFRDSSFSDDNAKENVRQLLKQLSPNTEMRVL